MTSLATVLCAEVSEQDTVIKAALSGQCTVLVLCIHNQLGTVPYLTVLL